MKLTKTQLRQTIKEELFGELASILPKLAKDDEETL